MGGGTADDGDDEPGQPGPVAEDVGGNAQPDACDAARGDVNYADTMATIEINRRTLCFIFLSVFKIIVK